MLYLKTSFYYLHNIYFCHDKHGITISLFWWIMIYSIMFSHLHFWQNCIVKLLMQLLFELVRIYPKVLVLSKKKICLLTYPLSLYYLFPGGLKPQRKALLPNFGLKLSYTFYELNDLRQVMLVCFTHFLEQSFQLAFRSKQSPYTEFLSFQLQSRAMQAASSIYPKMLPCKRY